MTNDIENNNVSPEVLAPLTLDLADRLNECSGTLSVCKLKIDAYKLSEKKEAEKMWIEQLPWYGHMILWVTVGFAAGATTAAIVIVSSH